MSLTMTAQKRRRSTLLCFMVVALRLGRHKAAAEPTNDWPTMGISPPQQSHSLAPRDGKSPSSSHDIICPTSCRCKFFIWDFVSYFKYKETTYQVQQNTFEGRGGKKFVRIQPDSTLEKWYPEYRAGQLRTDKCLICGHSWKDHLEYWWHCRRRQKNVSAFDSFIESSGTREGDEFAFHKKYVDVIDGKGKVHRQKGQDVRESYGGQVSYLVPSFDPEADIGRPKSIGGILLLALARIESLVRVEDLIWLSKVESLRSKQRSASSSRQREG